MEDHIVQSYDQELERLVSLIARMGGKAEESLSGALSALEEQDVRKAAEITASDRELDALEREADSFVVRLLALRQPVAVDLRLIVGALRVSGDLERIGDYASNVAKRVVALNDQSLPPLIEDILRLGDFVLEMLGEVLDAWVSRDVEKAHRVWEKDRTADELYAVLFRRATSCMNENPASVTACVHLMFISKNIERIGDHATNIAEIIHFLVKGEAIDAERPKGDGALPVKEGGQGNAYDGI